MVSATAAVAAKPTSSPVAEVAARTRRATTTKLAIRVDVAGVRPAFRYRDRLKTDGAGFRALGIALARQRLTSVRKIQRRLNGKALHGPTAGRVRGRLFAIAQVVSRHLEGTHDNTGERIVVSWAPLAGARSQP